MIIRKLAGDLFKRLKNFTKHVQYRNLQVSVIGAATNVGSNLSLLLKESSKITRLQLYDDDEKVKGLGLELGQLPGGPSVAAFCGDYNLYPAVRSSDLVVMISRFTLNTTKTKEQIISSNAPGLQKVCRALADQNPDAFFAITSSPINSMVPFVSALMYRYNCYNPYKVFGITHIDPARSRSFAAKVLQVNPQHLCVPVIGGHSEETIVPLFSNLAPSCYCVDACQADTLTRLVRNAGAEILNKKQRMESSTLAVAWSINEFIDLIADAIAGGQVTVNSYVINPHYGTRFFSGPTAVGPNGIMPSWYDLPMNDFESYLLNCSVPLINRDVELGEEYVRYMEMVRR